MSQSTDFKNQHQEQGKGNRHYWSEVSKVDLDDYLLLDDFFSGVKVLIERPHVVNPKLLTAEIIQIDSIPFVNHQLTEYLSNGEFCKESILNILRTIDSSGKPAIQNTEKDQGQVMIRNVFPKRFKMYKEVLEVVVLDYFEESVTFFPKKSDVLNSPVTPIFPYKFRLIEKRIQLELPNCSEEENLQTAESKKWLIQKILPKVSRWCQNVPKHPILLSIQLVPAKNYTETLHYLKAKYAKKFVDIWPEYNNTDPIKYVYEDLSIAAYLITFWAKERVLLNLTKKQSFVDLGCGHGLLDHILQSEGHDGLGIDLRKRKIWDVYGPQTKLIEMIVEPSDKQLYPEYDWIIGNHPDELTPWIPVIAARSSYNMRVFLLPCCFYTFAGKYARSHHDLTQYQAYINFIKTLCETMGFNVQLDRLRIPSTKRTCILCTSRTYKKEDEAKIEIIRDNFIKFHSNQAEKELSLEQEEMEVDDDNFVNISHWDSPQFASSSKWVDNFIPRSSVECTKNCTSLDKNMIQEAIMVVVNALIATENYTFVQKEGDSLLWNKGGMLKMTNICNLLNAKTKSSLKNQRGGFQTLIRNHKNIFEVKKDIIQLRMPSINIPGGFENHKKRIRYLKPKQDRYNKKVCFFYFHHPQGCPLSSSECVFAHRELPAN